MISAELENYEKLQDDYKRLMSEYEELKKDEKGRDLIDKKLAEIKNKHKEITDAFSKIDASKQYETYKK
jgi:hypothetical protein